MNTAIDAYAHIGYPRYGTAREIISVWRRWNITKGCIVLPPGVPDFDGLASARELLGEDVRLFGIPFGSGVRERLELAEKQIEFGISGMRLAPAEALENRDMLALLGEAHLTLMAINVYDSAELTRTMIDWLDKYPIGTVASPHFLNATRIDHAAADPGALRVLLQHPRMHVIFSRQGMISNRAYPHEDLKPWVEEVLSLVSWNRVMWGSELPVIYHRDEQVDRVQAWLEDVGVGMDEAARAQYLRLNAERLFFGAPAPKANGVSFPGWVERGLHDYIRANEPVPVNRTRDFELPLDLHGRLMSEYLVRQESDPGLEFREFLVSKISECT